MICVLLHDLSEAVQQDGSCMLCAGYTQEQECLPADLLCQTGAVSEAAC